MVIMRHQRNKPWRKPTPDPFDVPPGAVFKAPWVSLLGEFGSPEDDEAVMLECERLAREFVKERPDLADAEPEVVARRSDTDAILIHFRRPNQVKEGGFSFAVVALSWTDNVKPDIGYFECWSHWELEGQRSA